MSLFNSLKTVLNYAIIAVGGVLSVVLAGSSDVTLTDLIFPTLHTEPFQGFEGCEFSEDGMSLRELPLDYGYEMPVVNTIESASSEVKPELTPKFGKWSERDTRIVLILIGTVLVGVGWANWGLLPLMPVEDARRVLEGFPFIDTAQITLILLAIGYLRG